MGLREDRSYLAERRAEREALKENAEQQERADYYKNYNERESIREAHEAMLDNYYKYKDDVKKYLVTEALGNIYKGSIDRSARIDAVCESLLGEYIDGVGTEKLLKNMKFSESALLRTISEEVDKFAAMITADAKADEPDTQVIKPELTEDFWKKIDKSDDIDDITNMIRLRVSDAEEKFVDQNINDREDINSILKNTAERVAAAKTSNDNDYSSYVSDVEESEMKIAKDKIYTIQHEARHSIFDRMVRNLSEAVMNHDEIKPEFTKANGGLDMEKIVESARCMYTLLEMVSTIGLENVDQAYIEDTLKSIK